MNKIAAVVVVMLALLVPAMAEDNKTLPDMIGNWTGSWDLVQFSKSTDWQNTGNVTFVKDANSTLVIDEQNDNMFAGKMVLEINPKAVEKVLGIIDSENESVTMVDEDGVLYGWFLSPTELEMTYQGISNEGIIVKDGKFTKE